jgi:hypothetical protein
MDRPGSKQLSTAIAFLQSAGAKLVIIGPNAATDILTARVLAPAGRGALSATILWCTISRLAERGHEVYIAASRTVEGKRRGSGEHATPATMRAASAEGCA